RVGGVRRLRCAHAGQQEEHAQSQHRRTGFDTLRADAHRVPPRAKLPQRKRPPRGESMKPIAHAVVSSLLCASAFAHEAPRPKITGVARVRLYATNLEES